MSELTGVAISLQQKTLRLIEKLQALEEINDSLLSEIQENEDLLYRQTLVIEELQKKNEALRLANSLLGSEDFKKETKLKINSIIREIDYCIDQLSE